MANYSPNYNLYLPSRNDADVEVDTSLTTNFTNIDNGLANHDAQLADIVTVDVKMYGAKGDGTTDDTQAIKNAISEAVTLLPCKVYFPKGTYCYTDLGNIAYQGLTIEGAGDQATILKCTNTVSNHNAITMNAFKTGSANDPFIYRCDVKNIQVQGNTNTANIFYVQGLVHINWVNVLANTANNTSGIAYNFLGVMTSVFTHVCTSPNMGTDNPIPNIGLYVTEGTRGGTGTGNSTNNIFISCYFESVVVGVHLVKADQQTFIGGSMEACTDTGLIIESACKWTTCLGTAFETNTNYDINDNGRSSQFINIYASETAYFRGMQAKVSGGYFGSINNIGQNNVFENLRVNMHGTDSGGFIDTGLGTYWKNLYDLNSAVNAFIFPFKARTGITVGASPFAWTNTTGHYVEVIAQTGTLTQVLGTRPGASSWVLPLNTPEKWLVAPGDGLTFSYTALPGLSYLTLNGF